MSLPGKDLSIVVNVYRMQESQKEIFKSE